MPVPSESRTRVLPFRDHLPHFAYLHLVRGFTILSQFFDAISPIRRGGSAFNPLEEGFFRRPLILTTVACGFIVRVASFHNILRIIHVHPQQIVVVAGCEDDKLSVLTYKYSGLELVIGRFVGLERVRRRW